jgi:Tol biopolymer transport system component
MTAARAKFENSDDGTRSIVVNQRSDNAATLNDDLYLINFDTLEDQRFLTDTPGYDGEPDAVDDLRRIVFVSDRGGMYDLYTLLLDDDDTPTVLLQVTNDGHVERDPQWLTREQYQAYLGLFLNQGDPIILNQDATNSF